MYSTLGKIETLGLLLRVWFAKIPGFVVLGERLSVTEYVASDLCALKQVQKAPVYSYVLSAKPYYEWPYNNDALRKTSMRTARSVLATLSNIVLCVFVPKLVAGIEGFTSAVAVSTGSFPDVCRVLHSEKLVEKSVCLEENVGVRVSVKGKDMLLNFLPHVAPEDDKVVNDRVTLVDLGGVKMVMNGAENCKTLNPSRMAVLFAARLAEAENLLQVSSQSIVSALRPSLEYVLFAFNTCKVDRQAVVNSVMDWANKHVRAARRDASTKRGSMIREAF